ncbi:TlpA family protein disulfide reductase [Actinocrispum wychmicini]|uniref:Thiol-disulfide isomerase/thioredoxin n=1 Tax=Actinocrispum wychmicini TaxID=1213861 RepID=A0A4R2JYU4_9PSEU|nr:redoxin family protein [Actinocrispum wychmicini]TCO59285.1 thiol-disulfide isomerase/thioredoxin [Actinocrispum wychmicini]
MSRTPPTGQATPNRRRRQAARAASRRRRRWGWIATTATVLAIAATITVVRLANHTTASSAPASATSGHPAPDGQFTTVSGATMTVASLRGRPTLLWFVATWCPSCQAGTPAVAHEFPRLRANNVRVVEIEMYQDLGQPGPSIADFGKNLAGALYGDPDWIFGTSSADLTYAYNPKSYTDIYFLLDTNGRITYTDGEPAGSMTTLLEQVDKLA